MGYFISGKVSDMDRFNNLKWVNSMKGIAICGVVMAHTGGNTLPSVLGIIGGNSNRGVQLFFVISGYLAFLSLHNNKDSVNYWWFKKFVKLVPLYYISLVISTLGGAAGMVRKGRSYFSIKFYSAFIIVAWICATLY